MRYLKLHTYRSSIILVIINLILRHESILIGATSNDENSNTLSTAAAGSAAECPTSECAVQASNLLKIIDQTVKPCDNFYQFACGNYIKTATIPSDKSRIDTIDEGEIKLRNNLLELLKEPEKPNDLQSFKNLKITFRNCMNEEKIEADNVTTISDILNQIGGWPILLGDKWTENGYVWNETINKIDAQGLVTNFPYQLLSYYDPKNSSEFMLTIYYADTLVDESFLKNDNKNFEAYETFITDVAVLLGANEEEAMNDVREIVAFERKVYEAKTKMQDRDEIKYDENTGTIKELEEKYPTAGLLINLNRQLTTSGNIMDENSRVAIDDPKFVNEIGPIISNTPARVLANYQVWHVICDLIDFMPKRFREKRLKFNRVLIGTESLPERENACYEIIQNNMLIALSGLYLRKLFKKETKTKATELIDRLKNELKILIEEIDWMDDETRNIAKEKLKVMKSVVGYPEELLDDKKIDEFYKNLVIKQGDFMKGMIDVLKTENNVYVNMFKKTREDSDWIFRAGVATVNAYYSPGSNDIIIIAGILQDPFFNIDRPNYLNYGGIGYIIGHEITHGFDTTGRQYDVDGNFRNWWKNSTEEKFNEKAQCMIDMYSDYEFKKVNRKINGDQTKGENIADNGGLKIAYNAYKTSIKNRNPELRLPGLSYTPEQLFWINAASTWCGKFTDSGLSNYIDTDEHSPHEGRINVAFSNSDSFIKDFDCKPGTNMNANKKCVVW